MKGMRKKLSVLIASAGLAAAAGLAYGQSVIAPSSVDEAAPAALQEEGAAKQDSRAITEAPDVGSTVAPAMEGAIAGGSEETSAFPDSDAQDVNDIDD